MKRISLWALALVVLIAISAAVYYRPSISSIVSSSGLAAIATGNQRLSQDAQQIANPNSPNVTGSLVDLNQSLVLAEAGANVISAENQMLGTLLDVLA